MYKFNVFNLRPLYRILMRIQIRRVAITGPKWGSAQEPRNSENRLSIERKGLSTREASKTRGCAQNRFF